MALHNHTQINRNYLPCQHSANANRKLFGNSFAAVHCPGPKTFQDRNDMRALTAGPTDLLGHRVIGGLLEMEGLILVWDEWFAQPDGGGVTK